MNRSRLIALAAATFAALLAVYLYGIVFAPVESPPAPVVQSTSVDVLVAAKDIVRGEKLGGLGVQWRPWPRENVTGAMITRDASPDAISSLKDARASLPLIGGEPIVDAKIVRSGNQGFMSAILQPGMRAISIPITDNSAVAGFVLPNDRVDILITQMNTGSWGVTPYPTTNTLLSNVRVLAIDQTINQPADSPAIPGAKNAVLELEPQQAEVLVRLTLSGALTLVLRSLAEELSESDQNSKPILSEMFKNPSIVATNGTLLVRNGREQIIKNR